jgi:hypothetical protein
MGFAERVAGETCDELPDFLNLRLIVSPRLRTGKELQTDLFDRGTLMLVQGPS